jgi:hypothetical protein
MVTDMTTHLEKEYFMGRKKRAGGTPGEQLELIDVGPENMKKIKPVARKYKAAQKARLEALAQEVKLKGELLGLIRESGVKPMDDGTIRFQCDGLLITATPRDELVKVKSVDAESGDD